VFVLAGTFDPRGVKQADVALLGFPLLWSMPDDVRRNDLELYDNITHPEGPAMTWSMYAVGYVHNDLKANWCLSRHDYLKLFN
jgi:hypothetical protein